MTIFRKLLAVAIVAGGFAFTAGTDSAEAGNNRGRRNVKQSHSHKHNTHRNHNHNRHNHHSFKVNHHKHNFKHVHHVKPHFQPVPYQKYWSNVYHCWYYFDRYGRAHYIR